MRLGSRTAARYSHLVWEGPLLCTVGVAQQQAHTLAAARKAKIFSLRTFMESINLMNESTRDNDNIARHLLSRSTYLQRRPDQGNARIFLSNVNTMEML